MKSIRAIAAFVLAALLIAGCQQQAQTPIPRQQQSDVGGAPAAPQSLVNCTRSDLERWLSRSVNLMQEFANTVNGNLATPPDRMVDVVAQLRQIRALIEVVPVPDCARAHFDLVTEVTADVIRTLAGYSNGVQVNLAAFISEANTRFDQVHQREQQLNDMYNTLPRQ